MAPSPESPAPAPPLYEAPRLALLGFAIDLALGRRRSYARDGRIILDANPYVRVEGAAHVPRQGTFVVVMNHYSRRGLRPYHAAFAVSATVAETRPDHAEVRWAFASEMYGQRLGPIPIPGWLVRWVFRRVALVYNLIIVPRPEHQVAARAAALRRFAHALESGPVGLTPEALGQGVLVKPPIGAGVFLASLARRGAPFVPVATWEEGTTFIVRFGPPFRLELPPDLPRDQLDAAASTQVMVQIGRLMPPAWWGAYSAEIAAATGAAQPTGDA